MRCRGGDRGGFCVRVDWSNGSHTLECYTTDPEAASKQQDKMLVYWMAGPGPRAVSTQMVAVTHDVWSAHRTGRECYSTSCAVSSAST